MGDPGLGRRVPLLYSNTHMCYFPYNEPWTDPADILYRQLLNR